MKKITSFFVKRPRRDQQESQSDDETVMVMDTSDQQEIPMEPPTHDQQEIPMEPPTAHDQQEIPMEPPTAHDQQEIPMEPPTHDQQEIPMEPTTHDQEEPPTQQAPIIVIDQEEMHNQAASTSQLSHIREKHVLSRDIGVAVGPEDIEDDLKYHLITNRFIPEQLPYSQHKNSKYGTIKRYVQPHHLKLYPWIGISEIEGKKGLYCTDCVCFHPKQRGVGGHMSSGGQSVGNLVIKPVTQFNKLSGPNGVLESHQKRDYHIKAVNAKENFLLRREKPQLQINHLVDSHNKAQYERAVHTLTPIVDTVITLAKQNIAFRGDRGEDGVVHAEGVDPVINDGNFRAVLRYGIRRGDQELSEHCKSAKQNATYFSPLVQNELLDTVRIVLMETVLGKVAGSFCFSVLADDTTDRSKNELTSVCIRYVLADKNIGGTNQFSLFEDVIAVKDLLREITELRKALLGVDVLPITEEKLMSGVNIGDVIVKVLADASLPLSKLVGQGYDGATVMSSTRVGVAAFVKEKAPSADYFHCMMHKLNLSAASVIDDLNIQHAHATVKKVGTFFNSSAKRVDLLKSCIAKEEDSRITKNRLLTLSVTRFVERHQAVGTMRNLFPYIIESLEIMETWESSKTRSEARNLLNGLNSSKTLTSIVMLEHITAVLQPVSELLQSPQQDLIQSIEMMTGVIDQLKKMKQCTYFAERVFPEIVALASKFGLEITIPRRRSRSTMVEFCDGGSTCDFYENIWKGAIGNVVNDLSAKFDYTEKSFLVSFQKILPNSIEKNTDFFEVAENLVTKYHNLIGYFNLLEVERELARWAEKWERTPCDERPSTVLATLNHQSCSSYPHIQKILTILATLPVTTAEPERVFSKVNLTKSAIRASMTSERMENLVLIQSHRDVIPSVQEVVKRYLAKPRKILSQNVK
ncbi:hypothetical protein ACHWQZ_G002542 [Mnemiopsis leidyi]